MGSSSCHRRALVFAAVLLGLGSCRDDVDTGADGDAGDETGGTADVDDADADDLARLAAAMCERQSACGCEPVGDPLSLEACEDVHYERLLRLAEEAAQEDGYTYDAACLRELADCWEQRACGQAHADVISECAPDCRVHDLNLGSGAACVSDDYARGPRGFVGQCESGLSCLGGHGYAVCDTPEPLQIGDRCHDGALHRSCGPALYCEYGDAGDGECRPRVTRGSACDTSTMCSSGLRCDEGVCRLLGELGEDCESTTDCTRDLQCHPIEAECVERAEIGEPCRFPDGPNVALLACVEGAWCGEEFCEAPLEIGSTCMYSDGCPMGSACENNRCTACADHSCYDPVCAEVPIPY